MSLAFSLIIYYHLYLLRKRATDLRTDYTTSTNGQSDKVNGHGEKKSKMENGKTGRRENGCGKKKKVHKIKFHHFFCMLI